MKQWLSVSACITAQLISVALLAGCGGSSPTAVITTSGDDIITYSNNRIFVASQEPAELTVTATTVGSNTLSALKVSSGAIAGLNEESLNLGGNQFSTQLSFSAVENAKVTIVATALKADGSTHKNTQNLTVHNVVRYMQQDDRQILSIQEPAMPKAGNPAILFIHGNGQDLTHFYDNARDAAAEGYVAITMDFRTFDSFDPDASHMPDQIEDVRCTIQYLKANSAHLNINPDNIGIVGYSIGATLGLLATFGDTSLIPNGSGYSNRCAYSNQNTSIKAIAALSAPSDALHLLGTARDVTTPLQARHALERLIGAEENSSKAIRTHYNQYFSANPLATLAEWKSALKSAFPASTSTGTTVRSADLLSPGNVLADKAIPLYIMHGKTDLVFPCQHALWNVQAATQSDVYFYSFTATSNDHNWQGYTMTPKTQARLRYTAFFDRYLANLPTDIPTDAVTCDI